MATVAIIPARGGSRELTRKHLRRLGGQPVIAHTIRAAAAVSAIDRVVVSTDDDDVATVALRLGAEVPFRRPAELAMDTTPTFPVIEHAVRHLEESGTVVDVVVTLQPTSPLRTAEQIVAALDLLASSGARSVVSVALLGYPASVIGSVVRGRFRAYPREPGADLRRQASPAGVRITGAIYVTTRSLLEEGTLVDSEPAALLTEGPSTIDIDTMVDLQAARRAIARGSRPVLTT